MIGAIEWDFLVFRADPERPRRLAPGFEPGDERVARFDNLTIDNVAGHKGAYPPAGEPANRLDSRAAPTMQRAPQKDTETRPAFGPP